MAVLLQNHVMLLISVLIVLTIRGSALSTERLETLKLLEAKFIKVAQHYGDMETKEIQLLEKFLKRVKAIHDSVDDLEEFAGDPIRAFQLVKRYVMDWRDIHNIVNASVARNESMASMSQIAQEFPHVHNQRDLQGAVKRLVRFQEINDFTANDVIERTVNGSTISWHSCYEIGSTLFEEKKYKLAIDWLNVSVSKLNDVMDANETAKPFLQKFYIDALEYMAMAYHDLGMSNEAIEYFEEILSIDPNHNAQKFFYYLNYIISKDAKIEDYETSFVKE